jgi:CubicO group peptidase (beta-lactamase class C family)
VPSLEILLPIGAHGASPGCSVDVRRNGAVIVQRSTGLANLENGTKISQDTVFEAGSISKQFVAAGLALLQSQGRISLNDSVRRWLPELPERYAPITLRMMMHHTSGMRSWNNLAELTGRGEDESGYDNMWVVKAIARQNGLNNTPGREYLYSNSNFVLGATVIERASGRSLNSFFRMALFERLGMRNTLWRDDFRAVVTGRAQAYSLSNDGTWRLDVPLNGVVGAGGLMTTVGDLQRWNDALNHPRDEDLGWADLLTQPGILNDGTKLRYGLGLELDPIAGHPAFSHAGSTGAYRAWLGRVPDAGLSIALLCNDGSLNTEDLGLAIAALYLTPSAAISDAKRSAKLPDILGLAGRYRNMLNDTAIDVKVDNGRARFNGSASFVAAGLNKLVLEEGGRIAYLNRSANGLVERISLSRQSNTPVPLKREAAWNPSVSEMELFSGRFRSQEIDGEHRFELKNGQLQWIDPAGRAQPLTPLYRDTFSAAESSWTLRFTRASDGRIDGFNASITRARRIRYTKIL